METNAKNFIIAIAAIPLVIIGSTIVFLVPGKIFAGSLFLILGLIILFANKIFAVMSFCRKKLYSIKLIPPHLISADILLRVIPVLIAVILGISAVIYSSSNPYSSETGIEFVFLLFPLFIFGLVGYFTIQDRKEKFVPYYNYLDNNKISLGLFTRPYSSKANIVLANKYVIFEYDISNIDTGVTKLVLTDKAAKKIYNIRVYANAKYELFTKLCKVFGYETTAKDIMKELKGFVTKDEDFSMVKNLYLDINQASEAELTAIPGVTIAKAKHAIKVRNQQKLFLTINQFYDAINLNEEFIEQIKVKGNKIILNELPDYKRIEMQEEKH